VRIDSIEVDDHVLEKIEVKHGGLAMGS